MRNFTHPAACVKWLQPCPSNREVFNSISSELETLPASLLTFPVATQKKCRFKARNLNKPSHVRVGSSLASSWASLDTHTLIHTYSHTLTRTLTYSHTNCHTHTLTQSHTLIHTHSCIFTHTLTHTHMHTHTHTYTHSHTHTHIHTYSVTHTLIYTHSSHTHTLTNMLTHTHSHIHSHTHTLTHTHTHTPPNDRSTPSVSPRLPPLGALTRAQDAPPFADGPSPAPTLLRRL